MKLERCRLHQIQIPFHFKLTHAAASRAASDSLILELEARGERGYGEAVMRSYVGGLPPGATRLDAAAPVVQGVLAELQGVQWQAAKILLGERAVRAPERPLFGAVEAARMSLECALGRLDLFDLLELEPRRTRVRYGMILPVLPPEDARRLLEWTRTQGVTSLRVKVGRDLRYNDSVLALAREVLGGEYTLRVDANSSWTLGTAAAHLEVCRRHDVRIVEDPAPPADLAAIGRDPAARGFTFVADEPFATEQELERLADEGIHGMFNIRLSKNGGLLRSLAMARRASARGLSYCLGCHVGETGILSSLGRSAAALLDSPAFVDGSYDSELLAGNVTDANFDFGRGGWAPVLRGRGVGYRVDPDRLAAYAVASCDIPLAS